jgi:beta-glucuronidase
VYKTYAKPQLAEMIHEYRHHPCVVIWSIGNEFDSKKEAAAWYVKNACDYVRSLDPTRLVTFASDRREEDICFPYVDIISINEYYGWYYGTIYDIGGVLDVLHEMHPDKPILVSEFGSGTPLDVRGTNKFRISHKGYNMDYQLKFLQAHLEQIFFYKRRGYVAGGLQWVYNDFADPHRVGGGHPEEWAYVNLKGVVTQKRKRKPSFDLLKEFFQYVQQNPRE